MTLREFINPDRCFFVARCFESIEVWAYIKKTHPAIFSGNGKQAVALRLDGENFHWSSPLMGKGVLPLTASSRSASKSS